MEAQTEALGACGFVAEHIRTRPDDCRMCSDMCSGYTACLRSAFGGAVNVNVADTHTDAVPHPCIRVVLCCHMPFISMEEIHLEQPLETEIVMSALKHISMMVKWRLRRKPVAVQATRKRRQGPQREWTIWASPLRRTPQTLMTCPACSRSFSPVAKTES